MTKTILHKLAKAVFYLGRVRETRHQDLKPNNVLVVFDEENGKPKNVSIKITDFGLSGGRNDKKKGGTPLWSAPEVFGGNQNHVDCFSLGRMGLFLSLDYPIFLQLTFYPVEDEKVLSKITTALDKFEFIKKTKKMMDHSNRNRGWSVNDLDLSVCAEVLITKQDLITAGVPSNWFINVDPNLRDSVQSENFSLRYKRLIIYYYF